MSWTASDANDGTGNWLATYKNPTGTTTQTVIFTSTTGAQQSLAQNYVDWQSGRNGTTYP